MSPPPAARGPSPARVTPLSAPRRPLSRAQAPWGAGFGLLRSRLTLCGASECPGRADRTGSVRAGCGRALGSGKMRLRSLPWVCHVHGGLAPPARGEPCSRDGRWPVAGGRAVPAGQAAVLSGGGEGQLPGAGSVAHSESQRKEGRACWATAPHAWGAPQRRGADRLRVAERRERHTRHPLSSAVTATMDAWPVSACHFLLPLFCTSVSRLHLGHRRARTSLGRVFSSCP